MRWRTDGPLEFAGMAGRRRSEGMANWYHFVTVGRAGETHGWKFQMQLVSLAETFETGHEEMREWFLGKASLLCCET